jgi:hypothetical protein
VLFWYFPAVGNTPPRTPLSGKRQIKNKIKRGLPSPAKHWPG